MLNTLPVFAAFQYRMVVTNSTGAPLYLFPAPWDQVLPSQSSCLDLGVLGVQQTIPAGQSLTLVFNRSGRCDGEQGWLSLRASNNPSSTGLDYQQFWFDNDGGLEKHGLTSIYQNQLSGGGGGVYYLNVLTGTDMGHDFARYGYRMAVKNTSGKPIWVMAAPDDKANYGHLRSSCITPNGTSFGFPYLLQSGQTQNFYFRRSDACSGLQGWFSLRSSTEQSSIGTDFQQFWFDNEGGLEKQGVNSSWTNNLTRLARGNYALDVKGAEEIGGYNFRNYGYQRPEYANWPRQNPIAYEVGTWDGTRQQATMTWRTNGVDGNGNAIYLPVGKYVDCFGQRYWHTQSMVRLPSKNGRAYFARTDSHRGLGSFYVLETDADAYDAANDFVIDTPGTDGRVVYLDQYYGGSPIGDWNHPGDMSVVGNLLIIAGQQWYSDQWEICGENQNDLFSGNPFEATADELFLGQDADAVIFYDVSDPARPKYLGKLNESSFGFGGRDAIDAVALSKTTNGLWDLMVGGKGGTKHYRTKNSLLKPWPTMAVWEEYSNPLDQYVTLNSYERGDERLIQSSIGADCTSKNFLGICESYSPVSFSAPTVHFLGANSGYDLRSDTTSAESINPHSYLPNAPLTCSFTGGSAAVSQSGEVQMQCSEILEASCSGEPCLVTYHFRMPNTNQPPNPPTSPTPADNASAVPLNTTLGWGGGGDPDGGDTVTYDVRLTLPAQQSASGNPVSFNACTRISTKSCDVSAYLRNQLNYSWQVIVNDGRLNTAGPLWHFTTVSGNQAPSVPTNPAPADNAQSVFVNTYFEWSGSDPDGGDTLTYDLYLAKFGEPNYTLICDNLTVPVCAAPADFEFGAGYFWMVEASDGKVTTRSADWTFQTPPGFNLSMQASPTSFRTKDEVIEFTYTIENERSEPINEPFTVVDSLLGTIVSCGNTPLAAGATTTCTASYTIQESDVGDWITTNAIAQNGALASKPAEGYAFYDDPDKLKLIIEAQPLIYRQSGDLITYTYTIVNVGDVPLIGPFSVNHFHKDIGLIADCGGATTLDVGEQTSCFRVYTINSQDLDQYPLRTEASAQATGSATGTSGFSRVRVDKEAKELGFRITMSPLSFSNAGEVITYTYVISNEGNVPLPGPFTTRIDGMTDPITPCGSGPLQVGESTTCSSRYVVTSNDVGGGSLPPHLGRAQTDGASSATVGVTVPGATGDLQLTVVATPTLYSRVGEEVRYYYTITNTGSVTLTAPFNVTDDQAGTIVCEESDLAPNERVTCVGARTVTEDDLTSGQIASNAVAQGGGGSTSGNARSLVNVGSRSLLLTRQATPKTFSAVGDVITFTYTINNASDVTVDGPFTVIDDQVGTIPSCGETSLAPGATTSCTAPLVITQSDLDAGSVASDAFVTADGISSPSVRSTVNRQNAANQSPVAVDDSATTTQGNPVTINVKANDSDPDGDALTVTINTPPSHGTATVSNGQIIYTPSAGFVGNDSFTYTVNDGKGGSQNATVNVTVTSGNGTTDKNIYLPLVSR